jgi:hypothetical protein
MDKESIEIEKKKIGTISKRPLTSAAATMDKAALVMWAAGFSHSTASPFSRAVVLTSAWPRESSR